MIAPRVVSATANQLKKQVAKMIPAPICAPLIKHVQSMASFGGIMHAPSIIAVRLARSLQMCVMYFWEAHQYNNLCMYMFILMWNKRLPTYFNHLLLQTVYFCYNTISLLTISCIIITAHISTRAAPFAFTTKLTETSPFQNTNAPPFKNVTVQNYPTKNSLDPYTPIYFQIIRQGVQFKPYERDF